MLFLAGMALVGGLLRVVAPHMKDLAAARELSKRGMAYIEVGQKNVPIDGVWAPEELPLVADALQGKGNKRILEIGQERIAALKRAGCPACQNPDCGKLFPAGAPQHCDRCGRKMDPPKG
jgi:hypothetical protein